MGPLEIETEGLCGAAALDRRECLQVGGSRLRRELIRDPSEVVHQRLPSAALPGVSFRPFVSDDTPAGCSDGPFRTNAKGARFKERARAYASEQASRLESAVARACDRILLRLLVTNSR